MSRPRPSGRTRAGVLVVSGALVAAGGVAGLAPTGASASSHREAPAITDTPKYDNTDLYAFVSPDKGSTVTLVANWIPMEEPGGGPNFYPWATDAHYDINIDNDGDAKADLVYRWTFTTSREPGDGANKDSFTGNGTFLYNNGPVTSLTDDNLLFRQTYDLTLIRKDGTQTRLLHDAPVAPSYVGKASMPDYGSLRNAAIARFGGSSGKSSRSFAGQAEDPFFLDLRVFDLLYGAGCGTEVGNDTLNGYNVNSLSLQVPKQDLVKGPGVGSEPVIGVWSTTSRRNADGTYTQVSRLGNPLVNEAVIPYKVKDTFNAIDPTQDAAALPFVVKPELASLLKNVCGLKQVPTDNRQDLVTVFLTGIPGLNQPQGVTPSEQLRLNVNKIKNQKFSRLGVIGGDNNGFPNGRRLQDDVVDIALQVVAGEVAGTLGGTSGNKDFPNDLGDAVDRNASGFDEDFPYVALPHSGSVAQSSPPASHGDDGQLETETILTGGDGRSPSGGLPAAPLGVVGLGALIALAGVLVARRSTGRLVTA